MDYWSNICRGSCLPMGKPSITEVAHWASHLFSIIHMILDMDGNIHNMVCTSWIKLVMYSWNGHTILGTSKSRTSSFKLTYVGFRKGLTGDTNTFSLFLLMHIAGFQSQLWTFHSCVSISFPSINSRLQNVTSLCAKPLFCFMQTNWYILWAYIYYLLTQPWTRFYTHCL